jgi:hypothetical protein
MNNSKYKSLGASINTNVSNNESFTDNIYGTKNIRDWSAAYGENPYQGTFLSSQSTYYNNSNSSQSNNKDGCCINLRFFKNPVKTNIMPIKYVKQARWGGN